MKALARILIATALSLASFSAWSQTPTCLSPLVVTNSADSGCGSLRNAIDFANTSTLASIPGPGACDLSFVTTPTITFVGTQIIKPQTPLPPLSCPRITIDGGGAPNTRPIGCVVFT